MMTHLMLIYLKIDVASRQFIKCKTFRLDRRKANTFIFARMDGTFKPLHMYDISNIDKIKLPILKMQKGTIDCGWLTIANNTIEFCVDPFH